MKHKNNFDLLRLLFASAVVYSHSFVLLGQPEPMVFGRSLGNFSLHGFFIISGYLVSDSFIRAPNVAHYSWNRFLRIVPGLAVAMLASKVADQLCGHFIHNPIAYLYNGPLWTLPWEVVCYAAVALLGVMSVITRSSFPAFFAATWLLYLSNLGDVSEFYGSIAPLMMMFMAGVFISVLGERLNLKKALIPTLALLVFAFNEVTARPVLELVSSAVVFLWGPNLTPHEVVRIAYMSALPFLVIYIGRDLPQLLTLKDDISYGIYIYGWPVAQVIIHLSLIYNLSLSPYLLFALGMPLTAIIAWVSWRLIERPAMRLKRRFEPSPSVPAEA